MNDEIDLLRDDSRWILGHAEVSRSVTDVDFWYDQRSELFHHVLVLQVEEVDLNEVLAPLNLWPGITGHLARQDDLIASHRNHRRLRSEL